MTSKPIAIACDHAGVALKATLIEFLKKEGYSVLNLGTDTTEAVDYPDYAKTLSMTLKQGKADRGLLICGGGVGICIAANRYPWIRAGLCHDITSSRLAREHNDINVLVLASRLLGPIQALDCVQTFLATPFAGGRHTPRVQKLGEMNQD